MSYVEVLGILLGGLMVQAVDFIMCACPHNRSEMENVAADNRGNK
jgi:hypothetical protein